MQTPNVTAAIWLEEWHSADMLLEGGGSVAVEEPPGTRESPLSSPPGGGAEPLLAGQLATFSPFELMQFLVFSGKAGCLELDRGDDRQASCHLAGGSITEATCGHLEGPEAVLNFVWWRTGRFRFIPGASPAAGRLSANIETLMMDGVRLADELERRGALVPPSAAPLHLGVRGRVPADGFDCGLDLVASALRAGSATRAELESSLNLCPVKVRLSLALLAEANLLENADRQEGSGLTAEPPIAAGARGHGVQDLRVLVAHTSQSEPAGLLEAVQALGAALGGPQARAELSRVGPSFVRFRPPEGRILSLTLLPTSRRNRFLFETFVSSVDEVLFCDGKEEEAQAWRAIVPPTVRAETVQEPRALCDRLQTSFLRLAEARP